MNHYPQIRFVSGGKKLFNPITKRRYEQRPEERVRLELLERLLYEEGWSRNRVGFEVPLQVAHSDHAARADLILYDQALKPYVLVECKSPSERLSQAVAEQAARYNRTLRAPWLMLTNGIQEYWFQMTDEGAVAALNPGVFRRVDEGAGGALGDGGALGAVGAGEAGGVASSGAAASSATIPINTMLSDPTYWSRRGFMAGKTRTDADPALLQQLVNILSEEFSGVRPSGSSGSSRSSGSSGSSQMDTSATTWVQYVAPVTPFVTYSTDHYYQIIPCSDERAVAWTLLDTCDDRTCLMALCTHHGKPAGALEMEIDPLLQRDTLLSSPNIQWIGYEGGNPKPVTGPKDAGNIIEQSGETLKLNARALQGLSTFFSC